MLVLLVGEKPQCLQTGSTTATRNSAGSSHAPDPEARRVAGDTGRILAFVLPDNKRSSQKTDVIRQCSGTWALLGSESESNVKGSEEGRR